MLSNIFLCQHYFGEQGENGDNKVSTNENNLYIDLGNLFRKCKIFFRVNIPMACWETFITLGTLQMWNNHPHGIMDGISIHVLNRFTIMESVGRIRDFFI